MFSRSQLEYNIMGGFSVANLTTFPSSQYDDPAVSTEELVALREKLEAVNKKLYIEKRTVFRGWLKDIFLVQAILR